MLVATLATVTVHVGRVTPAVHVGCTGIAEGISIAAVAGSGIGVLVSLVVAVTVPGLVGVTVCILVVLGVVVTVSGLVAVIVCVFVLMGTRVVVTVLVLVGGGV